MTLDEFISVLQAAKEGKPCEEGYNDKWLSFDIERWVETLHPLRVKPTPREYWINFYDGRAAGVFTTRSVADCDIYKRRACVHVIEVIEADTD